MTATVTSLRYLRYARISNISRRGQLPLRETEDPDLRYAEAATVDQAKHSQMSLAASSKSHQPGDARTLSLRAYESLVATSADMGDFHGA